MKELDFGTWYEKNEEEIGIYLAESGADREYGFDSDHEFEDRYNAYLESIKVNVIIMVGNVGTGKTTECKKLVESYSTSYMVWNNDDFNLMASSGTSAWMGNIKSSFFRNMRREFIKNCIVNKYSLIIDSTNLSKKARAIIIDEINMINSKIEKEIFISFSAYDFGPGDDESLQRRLNDPRDTTPERWVQVHNNMKSRYKVPSYDEGFDSIIRFK